MPTAFSYTAYADGNSLLQSTVGFSRADHTSIVGVSDMVAVHGSENTSAALAVSRFLFALTKYAPPCVTVILVLILLGVALTRMWFWLTRVLGVFAPASASALKSGSLAQGSADVEPLPLDRCSLCVEDGRCTDEGLPSLRPSAEEAAASRIAGIDPYAGQRLNYLAGTSVPFEPLLQELDLHQRTSFEEFERSFQSALADCDDLDRESFYQEPDRFTLLLFLQADNFSVPKATKRLLDTIVWRQRSGFEDFVDNPDMDAWNLYYQLRPTRITGWDKTGNPFSVEPLGAFFGSDNGIQGMPLRKWMLCYAFHISLQQAAFRQASVRANRAVHRVTYVGDLTGIRFLQAQKLTFRFLRPLFKHVEPHFPECVGTVVLVNAPYFFELFVNFARTFVDARTMDRLSVHSNVPGEWLVEKFGRDAVPVAWGGGLRYELPSVRPLSEVLHGVGLDAPLSEED